MSEQRKKVVFSREAIRKSREQQVLAHGTYARFIVQSVKAKVSDKEDKTPDKRGSMMILMQLAPLADPKDPRTMKAKLKVMNNIILPAANPDFPEHETPNTVFSCRQWAEALYPEQLGVVPRWNRDTKRWTMTVWTPEEDRWAPVKRDDGQPDIRPGDDKEVYERNTDLDFQACELFGAAYADERILQSLNGLAVYGSIKQEGRFTNIENPSICPTPGKMYGPVVAANQSDE